MIHEVLMQMNLSAAFLCAEPDCQTVSNDSGFCPRCHSQGLSLAQVLDRKKEEELNVQAQSTAGTLRADESTA